MCLHDIILMIMQCFQYKWLDVQITKATILRGVCVLSGIAIRLYMGEGGRGEGEWESGG